MRALALFLPLVFFGCGGSGSSKAKDAAIQPDTAVVVDASTLRDMANPWPFPGDMGWAGVVCGTSACPSAEACCLDFPDGGLVTNCNSGCGDGGTGLFCDGPEDCTSGTPQCCANVNIGGSLASLQVLSAASTCVASCTANVPFPPSSFPLAATLRLCHYTSECGGDSNFPTCCLVHQGAVSISVCLNQSLTAFFPSGSVICDTGTP